MPRLVNRAPKYRKHKASGQAIVTIGGRDHYLGPHGTKASKAEYDRIVGEWQANGRQLPKSATETTVVELCAAFLAHAKTHYVKNGQPTAELAGMKVCLRHLREHCGQAAVSEFGPLALKAVRQRMIESNNSRQYVNQNVNRIRHIFKWGVANELVPADVHQRLTAVAGLEAGKSDARETDPIMPVADATIEATIERLPAYAAAMVRVQRLTGMRPDEVCRMRPCDIDRSGDVWVYRPASHKMQHKGRARIVCIGPRAQDILRPYLFGGDKPCFRPDRPHTTRTYRDVIHRAIRRANRRRADEGLEPLPVWNPNQLRHTAATDIRAAHGLEAAQVVLGHSKADTTQIYAERDLAKAREAMRAIG